MRKLLFIILLLIIACNCQASVKVLGDEEPLIWYNGSNFWSMQASGSLASDISWVWPANAGSGGQALLTDGTNVLSWGTPSTSAAHTLLSAMHTDTVSATPPTRGSIIVANSTPKWAEYGIGAAATILRSDGTDAVWAATTNITTLGTIATGVWNATAIDISGYTNLAVTAPITLTDDTVGITVAKDIVAGVGLSGGEDNVLPGADADTTLTFDATELDALTWSDNANASNVWTFDVSGTDHTMTAGSGLMTFSNAVTVTDTLTAGTYTGLVIGTDVQAHGDVLDDLNTLGVAASDGQFIVATGAGVFAYESTTTARMSLGVGTGDNPTFTSVFSSVATGTQPYRCNSITVNTNLNADLWDGYQFADYLNQDVKSTASPSFAEVSLTQSNRDYRFSGVDNELVLECTDTGQNTTLQLFTKDGDGTDNVKIELYGKGTKADHLHAEMLRLAYAPTSPPYVYIQSLALNDGTNMPLILYTEANTNQLKLNTNGSLEADTLTSFASGTALYIDAGGIIGTLSSSENYKKNIRDLTDSERIYSLRPILFDAKDDSAKDQFGLIAEELTDTMPELIRYRVDKIMATRIDEFGDKEEYIKEHRQTDIPDGVHYDRLVIPMLAEIQKLEKRIAKLEAK